MEWRKKMSLLFSIIVPVYGVEKHLRKCIDSLINQTYQNIEIILIDDGSPDNSPQICDEYATKDNRIKVIHKRNEGRVRARQDGVRIATGNYIVCVDSDDYVSLEYVQAFAEAIARSKADIVCCGYTEVDEGMEIEHKMSVQEGIYDRMDMEKIIFPKLLFDQYGQVFSSSVWSKAIKTDLYKKCQLVDCEVEYGEDTAIIKPCIFQTQRIEIIDKCTYFYVRHAESITRNKKVLSWNGPAMIAKSIREKIDLTQYDFQEQYYRLIVRELFPVVVSQFNKEEDFFGIRRDIYKHLSLFPYDEALKKCSFSYFDFRDQIIRISLKYRMVWFLYFYKRLNERRK